VWLEGLDSQETRIQWETGLSHSHKFHIKSLWTEYAIPWRETSAMTVDIEDVKARVRFTARHKWKPLNGSCVDAIRNIFFFFQKHIPSHALDKKRFNSAG
jgi:hypothetical protein